MCPKQTQITLAVLPGVFSRISSDLCQWFSAQSDQTFNMETWHNGQIVSNQFQQVHLDQSNFKPEAHDPWKSAFSTKFLTSATKHGNASMAFFTHWMLWWSFFRRLRRLHAYGLNPLGIPILLQVAFRWNHTINIMPHRKRRVASMEEDMEVMLPELWLGQIRVTGSWNL